MSYPTTLATLLAYAKAPYQLASGRRCELVGFDFRDEACAQVEYLDEAGTWARAWVRPDELIPLLWGFNALVDKLPNSEEVPVIEIARQEGHQWPKMQPWLHYDTATLGYAMAKEERPGVGQFFISKWAFESGYLNMGIANYLRGKGFAVGLETEQFIERVANENLQNKGLAS